MSSVAFVNASFLPRFSRPSRSPCVTTSSTIYYPYTLALATGIAEKEGFRASLIDAVAKGRSKEDTVKVLEEFDPSLVVIDTSTPSIYNDVEFGELIEKVLPKADVVLVGRHASLVPEETLRLCKNVKIVASGEFYSAVLQLLKGKNYEEVTGISYIEGEEIVNNPASKPMDVDKYPFVSKVFQKYLNIGEYFYASLRNPYLILHNGYGCPFNCEFCDEWIKGAYRRRSVDNLIDELKQIERELPEVKEILFDDPTFVVNEGDTVALCNAIIDAKIGLRWSINTRCNVSLEVLKTLRRAGCRLAHVGIESATQEALDSVSKRMNIDRVTQYLYDSKEAGILNHGCFIVGLPEDNKQTVKDTIDYAKRVPLDTVQVFPLIPYPGTSTYTWAKQNGYLTTEDYSRWLRSDGSYNSVISRPDFTAEEVLEWCGIFIREFYYRPEYIGYKLKQSLGSWTELKRNLTAFRSMRKRLSSPTLNHSNDYKR